LELNIDFLEFISQIVVGIFQFLILFVKSIVILQQTGDLPLIFLVILKQDLKLLEDLVKGYVSTTPFVEILYALDSCILKAFQNLQDYGLSFLS